jgi:lysophospholipid acyltransferase (LPLAT)-like uncharacterized protein
MGINKDFFKKITKKIPSNRIIIGIISLIVKIYIKIVFVTSKVKSVGYTKELKEHLENGNSVILMSWHGDAFILPEYFRNFFRKINFKRNVDILSSNHEDGKTAAKILQSYGYKTIYGSSINKKKDVCVEKSGAIKSIMGIIREIKQKAVIFLTPDGPRGPFHKINSKIVDIAGQYETTIFTLTISYSKKKQLGSWDKFQFAFPFGEIIIEFLEPMHLSKNDDFEKNRIILENRMNREL